MYGLALCLPSVGQPQGLPVPHEIPKALTGLFRIRSGNMKKLMWWFHIVGGFYLFLGVRFLSGLVKPGVSGRWG